MMRVLSARTLGTTTAMVVLVSCLVVALRPAPGNGAGNVTRSVSSEDRRLIEDVVRRFLRAQADADFAAMYEMLAPEQRAAVEAEAYAAPWRESTRNRALQEVVSVAWPILLDRDLVMVPTVVRRAVRAQPEGDVQIRTGGRPVLLTRLAGKCWVLERGPGDLPGCPRFDALPSFVAYRFLQSAMELGEGADELLPRFAPNATIGKATCDRASLEKWLEAELERLDSLGVVYGAYLYEYVGENDGRTVVQAGLTIVQDTGLIGAICRFELVPSDAGSTPEHPQWLITACRYVGELHEADPPTAAAIVEKVKQEKERARAALEAFLRAWQAGDWSAMYGHALSDVEEAAFAQPLKRATAGGCGLVSYGEPSVGTIRRFAQPGASEATASAHLQFAQDRPPAYVSGTLSFRLRLVERQKEDGTGELRWLVVFPEAAAAQPCNAQGR